jgi:predicted DNA-binding transcriptional regulator AlpA
MSAEPVRLHKPDDQREPSELVALLRELVATNKAILAALAGQPPPQQTAPASGKGRTRDLATLLALPDGALVGFRETCALVGMGESTAYRAMAADRARPADRFPASLDVGNRRRRWKVGAVRAWLARREAAAGKRR